MGSSSGLERGSRTDATETNDQQRKKSGLSGLTKQYSDMDSRITQTNTTGRSESDRLQDKSRDSLEEATHQGQDAKASAKEAASEAGRNLKAQAREAAATVREEAEEVGARLREQGLAYLEKQKSHLSSEVQAFSEAAKKASQRLEQESDTNLAQYVARAADYLAAASRRISEKDLRTLTSDLERSARRHPEIVFGGLFIAGLAFTRFLKASKPRRNRGTTPRHGYEPYSGERRNSPATEYPRPQASAPWTSQPTGLPATHESHAPGANPATDSPAIRSGQSASTPNPSESNKPAPPSH